MPKLLPVTVGIALASTGSPLRPTSAFFYSRGGVGASAGHFIILPVGRIQYALITRPIAVGFLSVRITEVLFNLSNRSTQSSWSVG
jgi:hypothetical protein